MRSCPVVCQSYGLDALVNTRHHDADAELMDGAALHTTHVGGIAKLEERACGHVRFEAFDVAMGQRFVQDEAGHAETRLVDERGGVLCPVVRGEREGCAAGAGAPQIEETGARFGGATTVGAVGGLAYAGPHKEATERSRWLGGAVEMRGGDDGQCVVGGVHKVAKKDDGFGVGESNDLEKFETRRLSQIDGETSTHGHRVSHQRRQREHVRLPKAPDAPEHKLLWRAAHYEPARRSATGCGGVAIRMGARLRTCPRRRDGRCLVCMRSCRSPPSR